jgi:signal peptidase I
VTDLPLHRHDDGSPDPEPSDPQSPQSRETPGGASENGPSESRPSGSRPGAALLAVVREVVVVLVVALGLSLLIKTLLVQAFYIPSGSMEDTLLIGDRVLVSKLTPRVWDLERGDIVVFSDPGGWLGPNPDSSHGPVRDGIRNGLTWVGLLPAPSDEHLIKRVIGLPGDKVACCDAQGRMAVDGQVLDEPYLFPGDDASDQDFSVTVPAGRLWVMGDHRSDSTDSRFHEREKAGGGMVDEDLVVGRAFIKVWPVRRAGLLRNPSATFAKVPPAP